LLRGLPCGQIGGLVYLPRKRDNWENEGVLYLRPKPVTLSVEGWGAEAHTFREPTMLARSYSEGKGTILVRHGPGQCPESCRNRKVNCSGGPEN